MKSQLTMAPYSTTDDYCIEYIKNINYIIGGITLITSIALMFLQSLIFIILKKNSSIAKSISFRLMKHLGYTEIVQQICHLISSFYALFYFYPDNIFGTFIASLLQTTYLSSIIFLLILTLNRLDVFFNRKILCSLNREKFINYSVIINYLWSVVLLIFFMVPDFQLHYSLYDFGWQFVAKSPNWTIAKMFENRYVIIILCFCFILYVVIIGKILQLKSYTSKGTTISFSEISLFLQGIISFLFIVFLESCWSFLYLYLPQTKYSFTIINYLYLFSSGTNAIVSLIFIKEIRLGLKDLIFPRKNKINGEIRTIKITSPKSKI
ncbi:Hypothetical protein SRAE_1000314100 [Strongyloides ratti]|uniref:7TM GPCR, serpentine receptor class x (Srx) family-containing protein n=1 Tax=Strongyloides ratti TaxID=34506 RepID=A0A090L9S2_STRRB|nr:Hypothetical protein SRAE_1000314100 [Strongyloides ratti]CEF64888.1 Hypothetical protein SRAE_1000314100 [Strongyloides ratti]